MASSLQNYQGHDHDRKTEEIFQLIGDSRDMDHKEG